MKNWICLLLCTLLLLSAAIAEKTFVEKLPDALLFTQTQTDKIKLTKFSYGQKMYPNTYNKQVDAEIRTLVDAMYDKALPYMPTKESTIREQSYVTVGTTITRTGDRWLSFLTTARIDHDRRQTYVDYEARVYDMITGQRVTLADVFPTESPIWPLMSSMIKTQLTAYFLGTEPDAEMLEKLCSQEVIMQTPFTLTPATLQLHYRADLLYPGREQLMHVRIFFEPLRQLMTETARVQTDNSMYKTVALTFDDGVSHNATQNVADRMRMYGAEVTFFVVGKSINMNQDMLAANHDAAFFIASHNYRHEYHDLTPEKVLGWKAQYDEEMNEAIGIRPAMMRAPGGYEDAYARAKVGMPIIDWSLCPSDAAGNKDKPSRVNSIVSGSARDGDIVLMHDTNHHAHEYGGEIVKNLTKRGFLCVTVDELFAMHGHTLEPNVIYHGYDDLVGK